MLSPENAGWFLAGLGAAIIVEDTPVGWAADVVIVGIAYVYCGLAGIAALNDLGLFVKYTVMPTSDADRDRAAKALDDAMSVLTIIAIFAILHKVQGRGIGKTEVEAESNTAAPLAESPSVDAAAKIKTPKADYGKLPSAKSTPQSVAADTKVASIESQFQANSLKVATDAHDTFAQGVANGDIVLNPNLSYNLQAGNFVDNQVRTANRVLADQLGLDSNTIRINKRLYAPDGSYTVPDLYFPKSGNIIDYSYQLKNINTPQIQGFLKASPSGTITVVSPAQIRSIYTIGP